LIRKINRQVVGNVGLYYVCYRLSRDGWNVMPTSRNARGIDAVIYSQDASRTATLQIKALTRRSAVSLGTSVEKLFGDWFVICRNIAEDQPQAFVLTPTEVRALAIREEKDGRPSYRLEPPRYEHPNFREAWGRIGSGM
jgi:hypothetical protein